MPVVTCPACGHQGRAPTEAQGHSVRCARCRTKFKVPSGQGDGQGKSHRPAAPPPATAVQDVPASRRRRPDAQHGETPGSAAEPPPAPEKATNRNGPVTPRLPAVVGPTDELEVVEAEPAEVGPGRHDSGRRRRYAVEPEDDADEPPSRRRGRRDSERGFQCPFCATRTPPLTTRKVSREGWMIFIVCLLFCIPLCWVGFFFKEETRVCADCGIKLGGN